MSATAISLNEASFYGTTYFPAVDQPGNFMEVPAQYAISNDGDFVQGPEPCLKIVMQPDEKFRFRYKSETGSHGKLRGKDKNKKKSNKANYPTVKLCNWYESLDGITVKVSLYTDEKKPRPHVLELVGINCNGGECSEDLSAEHTAIFNSLEIESKCKQEAINKLIEKQTRLPGRRCNKDTLQKNAEKEYKMLDMNSAVLCFQAFKGGNEISAKVFSTAIKNLKSATDLKICRISSCSGSCKGGDEIILLCDKIKSKDEVEVRFYDNDKNEPWENKGVFDPKIGIHHQVAIVFRTPEYKNNSGGPVKIELYRKADQQSSQYVEFTYIPDEIDDLRNLKKRKLNEMAPLEIPIFNQDPCSSNGSESSSSSSSAMSFLESLSDDELFSNLFNNNQQPFNLLDIPDVDIDTFSQNLYNRQPKTMFSASDESEIKMEAAEGILDLNPKHRFTESPQIYPQSYRPDSIPKPFADLGDVEYQSAIIENSIFSNMFDGPAEIPNRLTGPVSGARGAAVKLPVNWYSSYASSGSSASKEVDMPGDKLASLGIGGAIGAAVSIVSNLYSNYADIGSTASKEADKESSLGVKVERQCSVAIDMAGLSIRDDVPDSNSSKKSSGGHANSQPGGHDSGRQECRMKQNVDSLRRGTTREGDNNGQQESRLKQNVDGFRHGTSRIMEKRKEDVYLRYVLRLMSVPDEDGNLFLHLAIMEQNENLKFIDKILKLDPECVNKQNKFRETPMHLAVKMNAFKIVFLLLAKGGVPSIQDVKGDNCFHVASKSNCVESMKILLYPTLKYGKDIPSIDDFNYDGFAPVHLAILNNSGDCLKLLLKAGANVNANDKQTGSTPLHLAIKHQLSLASDLFSDPRIDIWMKDYSGHTTFDVLCNMRGIAKSHIDNCTDLKKWVEQTLSLPCNPENNISSSHSDNDSNDEDCNEEDSTSGQACEILVQGSLYRGLDDNSLTEECELKLIKHLDASSGWRKLGLFLELDEKTLDNLATLSKNSSPSKPILKKVKNLYQIEEKQALINILNVAGLEDAAKILQ